MQGKPGGSPQPDLQIGEASAADIPGIIELALNAFWSEYGSYEEAAKVYKESVTERWGRQLERGHARILLARYHDQIAGFLVFRWWFGWNGWLETIAVRESQRRKGIGTQLFRALTEKARAEGYRTICLAVKPDGEYLEFWRKFEAQRFGEIQDTDLGEKLPLYYVSI